MKEKYIKEVIPQLQEEFGYRNRMAVPKMTKITINAGIGQSLQNSNFRDMVVQTLERISGQKVILISAKKSISAFKIREGMKIGVKVTLRGDRMYDFFEKLVGIALPRVRDFRGIDTRVVDAHGNVTIGIKEHLVFPEIDSDKVDTIHGFEVSITTNAHTKKEGLALLKALGVPFRGSNADLARGSKNGSAAGSV